MRSISRSTKASGRRSSKAAHAARYRRRKACARSRPSGVSWGPSSAVETAAGMSSLRRRASCVSRAMSTECRPTGGRDSARTAAPESAGSASSRIQASTSRTSARWKYAADPDSRNGTALSSSAEPTTGPSSTRDCTSTATAPGSTPPASSRTHSAATAWACARSDAQRQKRTLPPSRPVGPSPLPTTAPAAASTDCGHRLLSCSSTTFASGNARRKSLRFFRPAPRRRWVAWCSSPATVT
jgi:hypothetical protein